MTPAPKAAKVKPDDYLLICPFCFSECVVAKEIGVVCHIVCENCQARGPGMILKDSAIVEWNSAPRKKGKTK